MAKVQTRRTVSISARTYRALRAYAAAHDVSISRVVDEALCKRLGIGTAAGEALEAEGRRIMQALSAEPPEMSDPVCEWCGAGAGASGFVDRGLHPKCRSEREKFAERDRSLSSTATPSRTT